MRTNKVKDEEIIQACETSSFMKQACEKLDIPFTSFIRRAKKLGVYKPNQFWNKGKTIFSDTRIKSKWKIEEIFCENSTYPKIRNLVLKEKLIPYECGECDNKGKWQGKTLTLSIDHINGNHKDNRLENLRFLCPNCHSQTPTFGNKNGVGNQKVSDKKILEAIKTSPSIRSALLKVGLSTGKQYQRVHKILRGEK
jgi:5-methylcytosine-specific restriction endonuclease McrA